MIISNNGLEADNAKPWPTIINNNIHIISLCCYKAQKVSTAIGTEAPEEEGFVDLQPMKQAGVEDVGVENKTELLEEAFPDSQPPPLGLIRDEVGVDAGGEEMGGIEMDGIVLKVVSDGVGGHQLLVDPGEATGVEGGAAFVDENGQMVQGYAVGSGDYQEFGGPFLNGKTFDLFLNFPPILTIQKISGIFA